MRHINAQGLALIKKFEGLRLRAYLCPGNVWTIGYGSTHGVTRGMEITEAEAEVRLKKDLRTFEMGVENAVGQNATANEFSAFVCLSFNIGLAAFRRSTALRKHLAGDKAGAADAILMWKKAGGIVLRGLVRRREAERALYLTPDVKPAVAPKAAPPITQAPPAAGCLAALFGIIGKR